MVKYEVRIDGDIQEVESISELEELVRCRTVRATTLVRPVGGEWIPARQLNVLRRFFAVEVWEAWEELDDVDEDSVLDGRVIELIDREPEESPESPEPAVLSEGEPSEEPGELELELDESAPEDPELPEDVDLEEHPEAEDVQDLPSEALEPHRGKILDFPVRPFPRASRGGAQPMLAPMPSPPRSEAPPPSSGLPARFLVLGGVVALTAVCVLGWVWYVNSVAAWTSATPVTQVAPEPEVPPEPELEELPPVELVEIEVVEETEAVVDELVELERELRRSMRSGVVDVCSGDPEDVESAMLIELSRLKTRVSSIRSSVFAWTSGQSACPEILELSLTLHERGELARDLASVALVVGKYSEYYDWQVRDFQVAFLSEEGTLQGQSLDAEKARRFWGTTLGLREMLAVD